MKTYITTAIAAIAFMFTTAANANNNPKVVAHHGNHTEVLVKVVPTKHCHCHACNELNHMAKHHNFNTSKVNDVRNCHCHTCNDIRHNERVMHNRHMAYNAPAKHHTPAPVVPTKAHRTGSNAIAGRR